MRFMVVWKPSAKHQLAEIWLSAPDERVAITRAADSIDQALRTAPEAQGESRSGNLRVLFVDPLGVLFEVHPLDMRVSVLGVDKITRKKG